MLSPDASILLLISLLFIYTCSLIFHTHKCWEYTFNYLSIYPDKITMADDSIVSRIIDDDRPIAVRKQRRSSVGPNIQSRSNVQSAASVRQNGIHTPPATPKRVKKRVRFSDPGPELDSGSSGLTPFIRRTSLSSTPTSKSRNSTPTRQRNRADINDSPISGTLQFAPLRQVLDGRVKRRLRRNRLSEEVNLIEWEKRNAAKEKKSEIEQLRQQLAAKDLEVQSMRDEQDIASQIEGESTGSVTTATTLSVRVQEQEREIQSLKAELMRKEAETSDEHDWTMAARDPYDFDDDEDNDVMITNYDEEFSRMDDEVMTTPTRLNVSFPSPPSTMPNTPCKSVSSISAGIQASLPIPDPEKDILRTKLQALESEISKLNASKAFDEEHHSRLASKLSDFIPLDESHDHTTLDSALDTVLTQLALSQTHAQEQSHAFSALSTEISNLGFLAASPDEALSLIASQFRKARLDLEYLAPGENVEGFENSRLLEMLVARVRYLSERVVRLDEHIDQYHEEEVLLRQQLNARVSSMDEMRSEIQLATSMVSNLREEVAEKETSNERLREALVGYREEVHGLEALIQRVEKESKAREQALTNQMSNMEDQLRSENLSHDLTKALNSSHEITILELERRLAAAVQYSSQIQEQLSSLSTSRDEIVASTDSTIDELRAAGLAKDAVIQQLRGEIDMVNHSLKVAQGTIEGLRGEKERGQICVQGMLEQMMRTSEMALGFINGEGAGHDWSGAADNQGEEGTTVVRHGGLFDGQAARRVSGGRGKRRRYDSGLGFLEEEDEGQGEGGSIVQ